MDNTKQYLSQEKYEELRQELANLKMVERKEVAETLEFAKSLGDLSENAEYHEARDKQVDIEDRILAIEEILKNGVIVSNKHHGGKIQIGSTVVLKKAGESAVEYTIVGSEEADIQAGKISHQSPIGEALIGLEKGSEVTVNAPRGSIVYSVVDIK
ncbi:MAG: transcription elongation factor GreA [Candidatus Vogelbacteria bacterium CG22_combo_CG10-13_8_21_14_all_37_9]|uniref:Transcription elongation factor GreA n=1 Tax=Candidatus Vogelbacteria bacterium CG22_combo_CG10-13_8_21_14_all_37_9 TaxID=1975046 RepID=A0A2H0BLH9_9BACT|nr:MAG: transcription elongation factor GreA [bacterium CG10_37_50]PIP58481.1 MAG: transcription elongation factor GreA [Candidatus Vogelbacteria bacterium CG22_combo_CG10-13_8_21_14_all_37_9]